ncbi:hypothetical protein [Streptomyces sp. NBC_00847]|uniref:hypothetical protein n=1 Tax=Streptomyces sp. NBC_00847 TaxID=2975850 RepID=UPI00225595B3|nr:hypothetical protein [Streptomyces sp. NBC_00847]MCX4883435.1 hypothetical protein [Streptomyces sp. NBC_00847]
MSDLGALDCPGVPDSPGAWHERSQGWLAEETSTVEGAGGEAAPGLPYGDGTPARGGGEAEAPVRGGGDVETPVRVGAGTEAPVRTRADADADTDAPALARADADAQAARRQSAPRRAGADPVKALMHRHRELCERAVDSLEIAAGLEAHGVTDRTATRFRHRDVFSLAEEMYARAGRDDDAPAHPAPLNAPRARADWALLTLLPGALCAATVAALHLTHGQSRAIAAGVGVLAVALALRTALSRGPLGAANRTPPGSALHGSGSRVWTYWLVAYALLGDGLLRAALAGGPDGPPTGSADGPWPVATAPVLALTLSCAPAAWCAHLFAARARRRLTASRGLEEFAASVRPLLLGTFALFLCALTALLALCGTALGESAAYAQTVTLGALLLLARLLTTHGFAHVPALALTATATAEATALATVFTGRLPGCGFLAVPVETVSDAWGPGSVPALACGAAALALLIHSAGTLARASAHAPEDRPC